MNRYVESCIEDYNKEEAFQENLLNTLTTSLQVDFEKPTVTLRHINKVQLML